MGQNGVPWIVNPRLPKDAEKAGASFVFALIFDIIAHTIPIFIEFPCKIVKDIVRIGPLCDSVIFAEISAVLLILIL